MTQVHDLPRARMSELGIVSLLIVQQPFNLIQKKLKEILIVVNRPWFEEFIL